MQKQIFYFKSSMHFMAISMEKCKNAFLFCILRINANLPILAFCIFIQTAGIPKLYDNEATYLWAEDSSSNNKHYIKSCHLKFS